MTIESSVPVDLANLGQVLACVGLMECEALKSAASVARGTVPGNVSGAISGRTVGRFEVAVTAGVTSGRFVLASPSGIEIGDIIADLLDATVAALQPVGFDFIDQVDGRAKDKSEEKTSKKKGKKTSKLEVTRDFAADDRLFPAPPPAPGKDSALPVEITAASWCVRLTSWTESHRTRRDNLKLWAGNTSGAKLTALALELIGGVQGKERSLLIEDPFGYAAPQSSSYRLDMRRDYVPLDAGFSPNKNKDVRMVGHPAVELLAAIGLEHTRPARSSRLLYTYAVPLEPLNLPMMRAVVGDADIGVSRRRFEARLGFPGDEKARCIKTTRELNTP